MVFSVVPSVVFKIFNKKLKFLDSHRKIYIDIEDIIPSPAIRRRISCLSRLEFERCLMFDACPSAGAKKEKEASTGHSHRDPTEHIPANSRASLPTLRRRRFPYGLLPLQQGQFAALFYVPLLCALTAAL